jgi:hypothetical protein
MEERKDAVDKRDADERLDANGLEERKDIDTRRWKAQDNNGHIIGSRQANSDEHTEDEREREDTSEYNKLDDRDTISGNESI